MSFLVSSAIDFSFFFTEKESLSAPQLGQNFTLSDISPPQLGQNLDIRSHLFFVGIYFSIVFFVFHPPSRFSLSPSSFSIALSPLNTKWTAIGLQYCHAGKLILRGNIPKGIMRILENAKKMRI
jgi:hypothetical protein